LTEIADELTGLGIERESINFALKEAERRVESARYAAGIELEAEKAKKAKAIAVQLRDCAKAADAAASSLFACTTEMRQIIRELREMGGPNEALALNAMRRALVTASMGGPLQLMHLAPNERRTFVELCDRWAANVVAHAERVLNPEQPTPLKKERAA
jgi:hypothetical protein